MDFEFKPAQEQANRVPYYEDAFRKGGAAGWAGHYTSKSSKTLLAEISGEIARLGGSVVNVQHGTYTVDGLERQGVRIEYIVTGAGGQHVQGQLDIAALPVKNKYNQGAKDKSLVMSLYMLGEALKGMWYMQQLSPGYAALMPWMVGPNGKTISQLWAESPLMNNLLPPGGAKFNTDYTDGEAREV